MPQTFSFSKLANSISLNRENCLSEILEVAQSAKIVHLKNLMLCDIMLLPKHPIIYSLVVEKTRQAGVTFSFVSAACRHHIDDYL